MMTTERLIEDLIGALTKMRLRAVYRTTDPRGELQANMDAIRAHADRALALWKAHQNRPDPEVLTS
jgi:hypothetical protein